MAILVLIFFIIVLVIIAKIIKSKSTVRLLDGTPIPSNHSSAKYESISDDDNDLNNDIDDNRLDDFKHEKVLRNTHYKGDIPLEISYLDFNGEKSTARRVNLKDLYELNNHYYLSCYCHLRKDHRTFRADRIWECTDLRTGVIYDDWHDIIKNVCK